jgi:alpha-amylase
MGVLLQGFYKHLPNNAVPSPADGDPSIPWWWDHLASKANALKLAGFTAVWLPPALKTPKGSGPEADGYGPFDDYDIGARDQMGSIATRFGTREQLQRSVAVLRANGIDVYVDLVEHHRSGDPGNDPFIFQYPGADGTPAKGRFSKNSTNFLPKAARDSNLGGPVSDDKPFGREFAPINGNVAGPLTDAADWLTRALDLQGYRLDDVKGLSTDFLFSFLNSKSMVGKFAVGEFFDGNRTLVNGWVSNPRGMQGRSRAFDFPLKFILTAMCNNPGRFNMADLDHAGLAGISPGSAVTFVENHDTDLKSDNRIVANKVLAYAYILTSEGYPCVYYRDYSEDLGCYDLKKPIDNLIWIHEKIADGPTQPRWKSFNVFAYERMGGAHLLVALNNDPDAAQTITVDTGFGAGVTLHDYTGLSPEVETDANGRVTVTVPANRGGTGYVCYSQEGLDSAFAIEPKSVTQDFEGASDLDIPPALLNGTIVVGKIWSGAGKAIKATLVPDMDNWDGTTKLTLQLIAPNSDRMASVDYVQTSPAGLALNGTAREEGFYSLEISAAGNPGNPLQIPFKLRVTYQSDPIFVPDLAPKDPKKSGKWGTRFSLSNVAIHAHMLPTGEVLYWGRRETPGDTTYESLNEWDCFTFLLNPVTKVSRPTADHPRRKDGNTINLFCSSHTFLADGRLLVTGGHYFDSQGIEQTTYYDPFTDTWGPGVEMKHGRWYPTVITLADGNPLVFSGSYGVLSPIAGNKPRPADFGTPTNETPDLLEPGATVWTPLTDFNGITLFPRVHVAPNGSVFMSGTSAMSFYFDTVAQVWSPIAPRAAGPREYAPSVMYDEGKVIYIGGGSNPPDNGPPTNTTEVIDLNEANPSWRTVQPMFFPRRQHNATVLPDGSVLVTGGSRGNGFNDLNPGQPVHTAELWDPITEEWTALVDEDIDRCYHSTAVLLPDGTVMSSGGGEYQPGSAFVPNPAQDSHTDAQIYEPPYIFRGNRPIIVTAPAELEYGQPFDVTHEVSERAGKVKKASLVRLTSVTHSFNPNQRLSFLEPIHVVGGIVTFPGPKNANVCPPGHYFLFLLSDEGVPSIAKIVMVKGQAPAVARIPAHNLDPIAVDQSMIAEAKWPAVAIGLTSTCPYGCWGNAMTIAPKLKDVEKVRPIPDSKDWLIYVYLTHGGLPDLETWREEIRRHLLGAYHFRGVEVTVRGTVEAKDGNLVLRYDQGRPSIPLARLQSGDPVQLRPNPAGPPQQATSAELAAYDELARQVGEQARAEITVMGPLQKGPDGLVLKVRELV